MPNELRSLAWAAAIVAITIALSACTSHTKNDSGSPVAATSVKKSVAGSTGNEGWYSTEQAAQGATLFAQKCAGCHGAKLQGGAGPAFARPSPSHG